VRRSRYSTCGCSATARLYKAVGGFAQVRLLRCLRLPKGSQYRQDRFAVLNDRRCSAAAGCGTYSIRRFRTMMPLHWRRNSSSTGWGATSRRAFRTVLREGATCENKRARTSNPCVDAPRV